MIVGGSSAFDVDVAICRMLGADPDRLLTNKATETLPGKYNFYHEGHEEHEGEIII